MTFGQTASCLVGAFFYAAYFVTCLATTWWAIDWVAGAVGIHLKLLGQVLALGAVVHLGCGVWMLIAGLLVGMVLVFAGTADPFAMAKVGGIGLTVGIGFRMAWSGLAVVVATVARRLGCSGRS